jgi:hypothetical protein
VALTRSRYFWQYCSLQYERFVYNWIEIVFDFVRTNKTWFREIELCISRIVVARRRRDRRV